MEEMRGLTLTDEAERFMRRKCYYFDSVFFDLLKGYRFDPSEVRILQNGGSLELEIRGLWYRTVLWEVPLMAMISELYFQMTGQFARQVEEKAIHKARRFAEIGAEISEFRHTAPLFIRGTGSGDRNIEGVFRQILERVQ